MDKIIFMPCEEQCINADEMARRLGRAPSLIRRMAREHKIPAHVIKNGCRMYYSFQASEVFAALRNDYGKEKEETTERDIGSHPEKKRA